MRKSAHILLLGRNKVFQVLHNLAALSPVLGVGVASVGSVKHGIGGRESGTHDVVDILLDGLLVKVQAGVALDVFGHTIWL